jgi:hypothetical protein
MSNGEVIFTQYIDSTITHTVRLEKEIIEIPLIFRPFSPRPFQYPLAPSIRTPVKISRIKSKKRPQKEAKTRARGNKRNAKYFALIDKMENEKNEKF